jgi:hypothetical protein
MDARWNRLIVWIMLALMATCIGCSQARTADSRDPVAPGLHEPADHQTIGDKAARHALLGFYTFRLDPDIPALEVVPLRETVFHLNALRFLEPPPPVRIKLSNFEFDGKTIDVDVELVHPFSGQMRFTGFDVCGIVITSGSITGFSDPDIVVAGEGDTRLVNADGLTRWWNPREFPFNSQVPIWGYIDGVRGTPDSQAHFTSTLNGYKYHADGLGAHDDLGTLNTSLRGAFVAGSTNTRHYTIELGGGLVFNYAIDACWLPPEEYPIVIPDSFPPSANRDEPWLTRASVIENTLYFDVSTGSGGGELGLDVDLYDWFDGDQNTVRVESPGVFDPVLSDTPIGGTDVYSTYHVDIVDPLITSSEPVPIWVSAEAGTGYEGFLPGKATAAYIAPFDVEVSIVHGGEIVLAWYPEEVIDHPMRAISDDFEPALTVNGDDNVLLSFIYRYEEDSSFNTCPRFATSTDHGHSFGPVAQGYIPGFVTATAEHCWNNKYTVGSDGQAFQTFIVNGKHYLQKTPWDGADPDAAESHAQDNVEYAGEMLYTSEGYPMMFGDLGGTIIMRRGNYPNQAGTGSPGHQYIGTEHVLVAEGMPNWLSLSRSTGKTSDGLCHLVFWHPGLPFIRMVSSTDISGEDWDAPISVFEGLAEIWVGAKDPSLWIDSNDGLHVAFAGEIWWGEYQLVYGYSADGTDWSEISSFKYLDKYPVDDGMNDTEVVTLHAYDETWVFLCYETGGTVWCKYKKMQDADFSDPVQVNEHAPASLPDMYPNGDVGVVFTYQALDDSGSELTDVYYRLAELVSE